MHSAKGDDGCSFAVHDTAVAVVDRGGALVGWTPAAEAVLGHRAADVCGRPVADLLADPGQLTDVLARRTPGVWEGEATVRHGAGGEVAVRFRVVPLDGACGTTGYLVLGAPRDRIARWHQDHALAAGLFQQDRFGLAVFDTGLRLVRANTPVLPYTGLPQDLRGHRLGDFLRAEDASALDERLRRVIDTGEPLLGFTTPVRTLEDPRSGVVLQASAFRLQESDGRALGVAVTFVDVTAEHRTQERIAVLHRATAALGSSPLSAQATSDELVATLLPAIADTIVVDVAEPVFTGGEPVSDRRERLALRRTAAGGEGADALRPVGTVLTEAVPASPAGPTRGALVPELDAGGEVPDWATAVPGARSALSAPMCARSTLLGRVLLWRSAPGRPPFEQGDLDLLEEIASRAALALDNVRRYTREHLAAVSLQRSLLPPATADTAAVRTASVYLPADPIGGVSGDWYDVIPLSSARVALVVGDVVGHGLRATAAMARLRTAVRTLADLDPDPDELLTHLDDLVLQLPLGIGLPDAAEGPAAVGVPGPGLLELPGEDRSADPGGGDPDSFAATCLYAVYDPVSGGCSMASAGHPPPAVVGPGGEVTFVPMNPGPPLGVGGLPFEKTVVDVGPGSVLALYTDGLIERGEGDVDEGMDRLRERLLRADALHRPLHDVAREIVAGLPPTRLPDDVTLLVARARRVPPEDTATWGLAADPAVVGRARELVSRQLAAWGLELLGFTTELVVSELVTNAIRHAGGPVSLRLIRTDVLTCEVSDPSSTQPRMRRARDTDEGGRGLYLVAQLTTRWGSRYTRQGKTIWAEQALPPVL
ncbi:SpoIIE family protein phosphatase [Streptomyces pactum]|uniref:SpoIIE family protein phosphatase n=1 Tax=Streptomyces pactum TaxID=68249 RepID=A0ABS0NT94_9ACTN|nr:SpoIIE family protein phosphatase [Streptomyces pactum]MBH5338254.1 SpoIIE family protein phosphatase [Streptomyces pactum]